MFKAFPKDYYAVRRHPDGTEERRGPFETLDPAAAQAHRWLAHDRQHTRPLPVTIETFEDGSRINTEKIKDTVYT